MGTRRRAAVKLARPARPGPACPLCAAPSVGAELGTVDWAPSEVLHRIGTAHPDWRRADGGCPACVQEVLLELLHAQGDEALRDAVQRSWPLDPEAGFGAIPTRLRLRANPHYAGTGITIAVLDAGFFPHPDLVEPRNRIRAWVDAGPDPVRAQSFGAGESPRWPDWDDRHPSKWHGLMTSVAAAGNGWLSHGFYRGMAPDSDVVLVRVRDGEGRIHDEALVRGLRWVLAHAPEFRIGVVSLSVAGDRPNSLAGHPVDGAVADLVAAGVVVVAAAGNDGVRCLVPPATAPQAITVGGIDDRNSFDRAEVSLWHSNYGVTDLGAPKPELVAPSLWVVTPILPGTTLAAEAASLFARRFPDGGSTPAAEVEGLIAGRKLVTPHYQHVEGTSFAAPIVAGTVACMREANPSLSPRQVKDALVASAWLVNGASRDRQGAGVVDAGRAVAAALGERHQQLPAGGFAGTRSGAVRFVVHDHAARYVAVLGSWDSWRLPGLVAEWVEPGVFAAFAPGLPPGVHRYKFLADGTRWIDDTANPRKETDGFGGYNSVVEVSGG